MFNVPTMTPTASLPYSIITMGGWTFTVFQNEAAAQARADVLAAENVTPGVEYRTHRRGDGQVLVAMVDHDSELCMFVA